MKTQEKRNMFRFLAIKQPNSNSPHDNTLKGDKKQVCQKKRQGRRKAKGRKAQKKGKGTNSKTIMRETGSTNAIKENAIPPGDPRL